MTDRFIPRTVVIALAVSVIGGLALMGFLASTQTAIPDSFDRLIFLLAGGLVGVLAKTSNADDATTNVNVERAEQVGPNPGPPPADNVGGRPYRDTGDGAKTDPA